MILSTYNGFTSEESTFIPKAIRTLARTLHNYQSFVYCVPAY
jgi:hypothetical protein